MKLAVVVQRYGTDINGGAELHARYVAEGLSSHAEIRVLTTCARDYISWRNELPAGEQRVNGIPVERFPVARERDVLDFGRRSTRVFSSEHSLQDELDWLDSEGPVCPELLARLQARPDEFDLALVFSLRYHHAYHAARLLGRRAVLVPTAERDPAIALSLFGPVLRGVGGIAYNTPEERALLQGLSRNEAVPGDVIGIGSDIPADVDGDRARRTFGLTGPYVIYVGRIDANKGCPELFDFFLRYVQRSGRDLTLVLIGTPVVDIPAHPAIRHLGFVSDRDKFDAIAGAAALMMPSYYESLSMVALEAWALGRPVIANARCDVLVGQCLRSNAGLYYQNAAEFAATLDAVLEAPGLAERLGANGRTFYDQQYAWPVIERKYLELFARLSANTSGNGMEPLPGWVARRRRTCAAASAVLASLPAGPVRPPAVTGAHA